MNEGERLWRPYREKTRGRHFLNDFGSQAQKIYRLWRAYRAQKIPRPAPENKKTQKKPGKNVFKDNISQLSGKKEQAGSRKNTGAGKNMTICHKFARFRPSGGVPGAG